MLLSPKSASETQRRAITSPRAMEVGTGRGNVQPLLPFAIVLMRTRGDRITCPKNEHVNRHTTLGENGLYIFLGNGVVRTSCLRYYPNGFHPCSRLTMHPAIATFVCLATLFCSHDVMTPMPSSRPTTQVPCPWSIRTSMSTMTHSSRTTTLNTEVRMTCLCSTINQIH